MTDTPDPTPDQHAADLPVTLDQIASSAEHYGVKVCALGEDGDDGWAAFTDDPRRAVAALHRHIRDDLASGPVEYVTTSDPEWWLIYDRCGCGNTCTHQPYPELGWTDHGCKRDLLPPCTPDALAWTYETSTKDAPGALPVITMEAGY
jgi:hypothetical protein